RKRATPYRADEWAAAVSARDSGHLLRRRDRNGRQHIPWRPQRGAHPKAVERRPQRRILELEPAATVSAGDHRSRVPLRNRQCRDAAPEPALAAFVDEARDRPSQAPPRFRPGHARAPPAREQKNTRVRAPLRVGADPGRREPVALPADRGSRPVGVEGDGPAGAFWLDRAPGARRAALLPDPGPTLLLLAQPSAPDC